MLPRTWSVEMPRGAACLPLLTMALVLLPFSRLAKLDSVERHSPGISCEGVHWRCRCDCFCSCCDGGRLGDFKKSKSVPVGAALTEAGGSSAVACVRSLLFSSARARSASCRFLCSCTGLEGFSAAELTFATVWHKKCGEPKPLCSVLVLFSWLTAIGDDSAAANTTGEDRSAAAAAAPLLLSSTHAFFSCSGFAGSLSSSSVSPALNSSCRSGQMGLPDGGVAESHSPMPPNFEEGRRGGGERSSLSRPSYEMCEPSRVVASLPLVTRASVSSSRVVRELKVSEGLWIGIAANDEVTEDVLAALGLG